MKAFLQRFDNIQFTLFLINRGFIVSAFDNNNLENILPGDTVLFHVSQDVDLHNIIKNVIPKNCTVIVFGSVIWLPSMIVAVGKRTLTIHHGDNPYEDKVVIRFDNIDTFLKEYWDGCRWKDLTMCISSNIDLIVDHEIDIFKWN